MQTLNQMLVHEAQAKHAEHVRQEVLRLDLSRAPAFDLLTPAQFAAIYNGYGPDSWPASLRAAITAIYDNWEPLAAVHDVDFYHADGSRKGWMEATARWGINASIALSDRYPMRKPWLWPARAVAWAKLRASYRALQLGSWDAWVAASLVAPASSVKASPAG